MNLMKQEKLRLIAEIRASLETLRQKFDPDIHICDQCLRAMRVTWSLERLRSEALRLRLEVSRCVS